MTASETVARNREAIHRLAARYGALEIRLIGSVARGDEDDASDIDFLVRMSPGRSLLDLGGLLMDLEALLGREVDVVSEGGLYGRFREQVLREAIAV